jgi:hypothetical protein
VDDVVIIDEVVVVTWGSGARRGRNNVRKDVRLTLVPLVTIWKVYLNLMGSNLND